jgi:hypothetical protein
MSDSEDVNQVGFDGVNESVGEATHELAPSVLVSEPGSNFRRAQQESHTPA